MEGLEREEKIQRRWNKEERKKKGETQKEKRKREKEYLLNLCLNLIKVSFL